MQAVLVQSMKDKFNFSEPNIRPETPAAAGTHLVASGPNLCTVAQTWY